MDVTNFFMGRGKKILGGVKLKIHFFSPLVSFLQVCCYKFSILILNFLWAHSALNSEHFLCWKSSVTWKMDLLKHVKVDQFWPKSQNDVFWRYNDIWTHWCYYNTMTSQLLLLLFSLVQVIYSYFRRYFIHRQYSNVVCESTTAAANYQNSWAICRSLFIEAILYGSLVYFWLWLDIVTVEACLHTPGGRFANLPPVT